MSQPTTDFISLTDIAKHKEPDRADHVIRNWMRNRNTVEFLGIWEGLHNPSFKPLEFEGFRNRSGLNSFVLTPRQWIETTGAIGIQSKSGRYGGTCAHKDIAFEFAAWISVEFTLFLIKEFQRLSLSWNINRTLSKLNYRIHTDAAATDNWQGIVVIPSGEIRPATRTPKVLTMTPSSVRPAFGWLNWTVVAVSLGGMIAVGFWFMKREKSGTTDSYFRGGQRIPWWVAGLSIFATMLSSLTFMGIRKGDGRSQISGWHFLKRSVAPQRLIFTLDARFIRR